MWPPYLEHWPVGHFFRSFDRSLLHLRHQVLLAWFWYWHLSQQQTHGSPGPGMSRSVAAGEEIVGDVDAFLGNCFEVLLFTVEWLRTGCCFGGTHPLAGGWGEPWWCCFACLELLLPMVGCWRGARWVCLLLKKCSKKFDEHENCARFRSLWFGNYEGSIKLMKHFIVSWWQAVLTTFYQGDQFVVNNSRY